MRENDFIDLLDQLAIEFISHKTLLDQERVRKIFFAGKPWFTFSNSDRGKNLKNLAREMAECILETQLDLQNKLNLVTEQTGENLGTVRKVLWGVVDFQVRVIEELLHQK